MSCVDSEDSENLGHSTEDIVRKYEHLTPAGVHAALAYYVESSRSLSPLIHCSRRVLGGRSN